LTALTDRLSLLSVHLSSLPSFYALQASTDKDRWEVENELLKREARTLARKLINVAPKTSDHQAAAAAASSVYGQAFNYNYGVETVRKAAP
jgi:hypothetical protein